MECPKCHFDHPLQRDECLRCGVIFSKYLAYIAAHPAPAPGAALAAVADIIEPPATEEQQGELRSKAKNELICRAVAPPAALLFGWIVVATMPILAELLRMWAHESGHAITAWLCGYPALPTAWFTLHSPERVPIAGLLLAAALAFGGYTAWRLERWFWVAASALGLVLVVAGNLRTEFQANCLITFGGDAGSFVVSTMLIATFYGRAESAVRRKHLRWVLLVIGAIAFMDAYATWAGGFEKIVHWIDDTDERGPTDLAKLTQLYGWAIGEMQVRFLRVAHWCFAAMAAMYAAGIAQAARHKAGLDGERSL
ncbi:MAG: hypothetical protein JO041_10185 [Acidobacteria bacterium]|nr:hypothetical protein [Acidobacteriota bacterium]